MAEKNSFVHIKKDLPVMYPYQGTAVLGVQAFVDGFNDYPEAPWHARVVSLAG